MLTATTNNATPSSSGISRLTVGGFGVALRVTASGSYCTRRSERTAAKAASAGTRIRTPRYPSSPGVTSAGKNTVPVTFTFATCALTAR